MTNIAQVPKVVNRKVKKSFIPDFRRETQAIIKELGIKASTIAKEFGVTTSTAYNWIGGKKSPTRRNFERLKQLAEHQTADPSSYLKGEEHKMSLTDLVLAIGELQGMVKTGFKEVHDRIDKLEGVKKKI